MKIDRFDKLWIATVTFLALFIAILSYCNAASAQQLNVSLIPTVTASALKGTVLKASPGLVYSAYATNITSTAGFFVLLNAVAVPSDGAITPIACVAIPASGTASIDYIPSPPARFTTGITAALTSASTCFTLTTGTITAFISGLVQ